MKNSKQYLIIIAVAIAPPFLLNLILLIPAFTPVVGEPKDWLQFWPTYVGAIASFVVIFYTAQTLRLNQQQLLDMEKEKRESIRARLVFDVIVSQTAFFLRIKNIGKESAHNIRITVNDDFLDALPLRDRRHYLDLSNPFYVSPDKPVYIYIGFCEDINQAWKDKDVKLVLEGIYNDLYEIHETIHMNQFINKIHMLVRDDLTNMVEYIKKGIMVQNDQYFPIQKSLHIIAKKIERLDFTTLNEVLEKLNEESEAEAETDEKTEESAT